jgi:trehalose 6-phosphate synthase
MNLVAKEYVAAQDPEDPGVLVLSPFAGAAHELDAALQVNPFDVDAMVEAIAEALVMPLAERRRRWRSMMSALQKQTVRHWATSFIDSLKATRTEVRRVALAQANDDLTVA